MTIETQRARVANDERPLVCGHSPSPHGDLSTGTAIERSTGDEICWHCADERVRESMRTESRLSAYLTDDGRITTWSGGELARVVSNTKRRIGFGLNTFRHYICAVDSTGRRWHGTSPGPGMYCLLRASKGSLT